MFVETDSTMVAAAAAVVRVVVVMTRAFTSDSRVMMIT